MAEKEAQEAEEPEQVEEAAEGEQSEQVEEVKPVGAPTSQFDRMVELSEVVDLALDWR